MRGKSFLYDIKYIISYKKHSYEFVFRDFTFMMDTKKHAHFTQMSMKNISRVIFVTQEAKKIDRKVFTNTSIS